MGLITIQNFYYCRFYIHKAKVICLITIQNFYYCRLRYQIENDQCSLITIQNFYYCRSFLMVITCILGLITIQKIVTAHSRRCCDLNARSDAVVSINGAFMVNW